MGAAALAFPMIARARPAGAIGVAPRVALYLRATGAPEPATIRVFLAPRGGLHALEAAVIAASSPGSRRYRRFLTPAQFRARYEPTRARVRKVERSLKAVGFEILAVERYHRWIVVRGSSGIPPPLASDVLGTNAVAAPPRSARSSKPLPAPGARRDTSIFQITHPCSRYFGERPARVEADGKTPLPAFRGTPAPYAVCGYAPRQLRLAYEGATRLNGKGVTVAVVDPFTTATIRSDADRFAVLHGDAPFAGKQFSERLPAAFDLSAGTGCGTAESWALEESLDVEAVHEMAPEADVRYYAAPRCDDPGDPGTIAALDAVVDENRASIVTNSYGDPEALFPAGSRAGYEQAFLQAAMQGITVLFATGDFGGIGSYPSSDPWVTAVGGTSVAINARGRLAFQAAWESDNYNLSSDARSWERFGVAGGGGGGFSKLFARPAWQHGIVPADSPPGRGYPDLAMDADPQTGMEFGMTQRFPNGVHFGQLYTGGTSLASPLMAGMEALAVQATGGRLGWINPAIYHEARQHSHTFTDIVRTFAGRACVRVVYLDPLRPGSGRTYHLRTLGESSGLGTPLAATRGWDDATGVGTPNRSYFISQGR